MFSKQETMLGEQLGYSTENFDIVSFIRFCDRDFHGQENKRYSIVKAYTHEEIMCLTAAIADEEMPLLATGASSSQSSLEKHSHGEHQLFTSSTTTKNPC